MINKSYFSSLNSTTKEVLLRISTYRNSLHNQTMFNSFVTIKGEQQTEKYLNYVCYNIL